jgi:hypothetical protein
MVGVFLVPPAEVRGSSVAVLNDPLIPDHSLG